MERLETLVATLAQDPDIRELAKPETIASTRNSYGMYHRRLVHLAQNAPLVEGASEASQATLWATVLVAAGANRQGVADGLRTAYPA